MYLDKTEHYNDATAVERESRMSVELSELHRATEELLKHSDRLEARLTGVLQPQPKSADTSTPKEALPSRLEEIRNCRERVDAANYILKSILSRLEV